VPPPVGALHWTPQVTSLLSSAQVTHRDQAAQHVHHEGLVSKSRIIFYMRNGVIFDLRLVALLLNAAGGGKAAENRRFSFLRGA
jgi:hypothetical protein